MREGRDGPHEVAYPGRGLGLRKYSGEAARALSPGKSKERGLDESLIGRLREISPETAPEGIGSILIQLFKRISHPTPRPTRRTLKPFRKPDSFTFIYARKAAIEGGRQLFYAAFPTLTIAGFVALL